MPAVVVRNEDKLNASSVDDLGSAAEVEAALESASKLTCRVEETLDHLLVKASASAASRAATLGRISQIAVVVSDDASELSGTLNTAARNASALSVRIRYLDKALDEGTSALTRVDHVLTLRVCAEGAKTSLSAGDLLSAAAHVQRYLGLANEVHEDPSSLAAVSQMNQSIAELTRKVREKADGASEASLIAPSQGAGSPSSGVLGVVAASKLFVPIGLAKEGISRVCRSLKTAVAREAESDLRSLLMDHDSSEEGQGAQKQQDHCIALARLFETVAGCLHETESAVGDAFGARAILEVAMALQDQCDVQADKILSRYAEEQRLDEIVFAVKSEAADARDLDSVLNDLVLLSQRTVAYFEFLTGRCSAAMETIAQDGGMAVRDGGEVLDGDEVDQNRIGDEALSSSDVAESSESVTVHMASFSRHVAKSKLSEVGHTLAARYTLFESYFMKENVRKALRIDERAGDAAKTSTAVDDFFFVLQKVVNRALAYGGAVDTLVTMMDFVNACLSEDLLSHIRRRLRETEDALDKTLGSSTETSSLPSAALTVSYLAEFAKANIPSSSSAASGIDVDGANGPPYDFFVALNNASVSCDYAQRFRAQVEQMSSTTHAASGAEANAKLLRSLELVSETSRALAVTSENGISKITGVMTSRVASETGQLLSSLSYVLSESSSGADGLASSASFAEPFLDEIETKVLHPSVEERMTEGLWDSFVRSVAVWAVNRVEEDLFALSTGRDLNRNDVHGKRFNALGGLKADRDVRSMSAYFAGKCRGSSVRDVFARLSQAAMLITLEQPLEVYDIWGSNAGGMTWRLSPVEVRRVLKLRVDFNEAAVTSLQL